MVLNDIELKEKVYRHCGKKIDRGEKPCENCEKKLFSAKIIADQKKFLWRQYEQWHKPYEYKSKKESY